LLRERYIETRGRTKALNNLITATVPTFIFIFNGLLYLLDMQIPATKHETAKILAEELNLDKELFLFLLQAKTDKSKHSPEEIDIMFQKYLKEIRSLAILIDRWETNRKGVGHGEE
jgi:hypothetical protein